MEKYKSSPIAIFCFNRPKHLNILLKSLKKNKHYKKHIYYFFCDGPRKNNNLDLDKIYEIKGIIKKFKVKKKIKFNISNKGLSKNIISGVNHVFKKENKIIVLEDDLEVSPFFLEFMSSSLSFFSGSKDIGSVSGFSYIHNIKRYKNIKWFKTYRHCSWSWGTWRRVWKKINWDTKNIKNNFEFMDIGGEDLKYLLRGYNSNILDSWAIRFNYHCIKNNLLSIAPRFSMIKNNGFDFSGTNTFNIFKKPKIKFDMKKTNFISKPIFSNFINQYIRDNNKKNKKLVIKLLLKKLF